MQIIDAANVTMGIGVSVLVYGSLGYLMSAARDKSRASSDRNMAIILHTGYANRCFQSTITD